ncbi:branched-chain amino acid ABC transporter substrate-binding protein [Couchioplanes azureus]|uniref:branched-chain amino acid ABC transporter substrate-binding protein n=1 Tax=Couchioplanes caeruleus TaxID=56438 RepID=UPI001670CBD6|nr:branched-chain amino acid ABC transporter substrate-binding protein [Couchioplanes caeruleus]GGQ86565.1 branched chain amino acid ABC transporter substrate-binding protein [Couchioplanes caeruleus subsp. azureus]
MLRAPSAHLVAIGAAVVTLAVGGCAAPDQPAAAEPIRIGALLPLSGGNAPSGQADVAAARLAVDEVNAAGGLLGRPVELVVKDDACDPATAVIAANELVAADVVASVGGFCSNATIPTLKIFHTAGIPAVVPLANSTDLLAPGYNSAFLISGTTRDEAKMAHAWMRELHTARLAVVDDGTSYSVSLAQSTAAADSGIVVALQSRLSQDADDYTDLARRVIDGRADMVYFTGYYVEAGRLIKDLRKAGYTGKIMLADGCIDAEIFKHTPKADAEGVYGTSFPMPQFQPGIEDWTARYRTANGVEPLPSTLETYDATKLTLDAVRRAGTIERQAVRDAIASTDSTLTTGRVRFTANGARENPTFLRVQVRDGVFTLLPQTATKS